MLLSIGTSQFGSMIEEEVVEEVVEEVRTLKIGHDLQWKFRLGALRENETRQEQLSSFTS